MSNRWIIAVLLVGPLLIQCAAYLNVPESDNSPPSASLDSSWNGTGRASVTLSANALVRGLAVQTDGKVVAAGKVANAGTDLLIARLDTLGQPDRSFNGTGFRQLHIGEAGGGDQFRAVDQQPDGKIVAAGFSANVTLSDSLDLVRFTTNGTLDTSFNGTGSKTIVFSGAANSYAQAVKALPSGAILNAGCYDNGGAKCSMLAARFLSNGSLDTSFNGSGFNAITIGGVDDSAYAMAVDASGSAFLAGQTYNGANYDAVVAKVKPNGQLDTSFHGSGISTVSLGSGNDSFQSVALQIDGKIVAGGYAGTTIVSPSLVRFTSLGTLDSSFNGTGVATFAFAGAAQVNAIGIQSDGKILAAVSSNNNTYLARLTSSGQLDTSFNAGLGYQSYGLSSQASNPYALTLQSDGKILVGGDQYQGAIELVNILRIFP